MNFAEIIKSAFDANKGNLGVQNVFTPVDTLANYFDFKSAIKNETNIGIMYNVEFLEYFLRDLNYINGKKFTYFYDSIVDRNLAFKVMMYYKYNNVELISIENFNVKEFNMPKHFDVVFTNPPYNKNLDLKLINNLIKNNIADEIIAVHPATFLFNKSEGKRDKYGDIKTSGKLKEVTFFWGNDIFGGTIVGHAHCISVWNMNKNDNNIHVIDHAFIERKEVYGDIDKFEYDTDINKVNVHSKFIEESYKIFKKFINCDSIFDHRASIDDNKTKTKFGVKFPSMKSGLDYKNRSYGEFFSLMGKGKETQEEAKIDETWKPTDYYMSTTTYKNDYPVWYFNTDEERTNFINYCKTKCVRFLLSLIKHNAQLIPSRPTRIIPWMDFTKEWTDEKLIKEFGIDEELWNYIDKFILDYYEDYKTTARGNI